MEVEGGEEEDGKRCVCDNVGGVSVEDKSEDEGWGPEEWRREDGPGVAAAVLRTGAGASTGTRPPPPTTWVSEGAMSGWADAGVGGRWWTVWLGEGGGPPDI